MWSFRSERKWWKSSWKMWQVYASFQVSGKRLPKNFSKTDSFFSSPLLVLLCFSPLLNLFTIQSWLLIFHCLLPFPLHSSHITIDFCPSQGTSLKPGSSYLMWNGRAGSFHRYCFTCFGAFISLFFSMARKRIHHLSRHQNSWTFLWWKKILTSIHRESFYQNYQFYKIMVNQSGLVIESLKQP